MFRPRPEHVRRVGREPGARWFKSISVMLYGSGKHCRFRHSPGQGRPYQQSRKKSQSFLELYYPVTGPRITGTFLMPVGFHGPISCSSLPSGIRAFRTLTFVLLCVPLFLNLHFALLSLVGRFPICRRGRFLRTELRLTGRMDGPWSDNSHAQLGHLNLHLRFFSIT